MTSAAVAWGTHDDRAGARGGQSDERVRDVGKAATIDRMRCQAGIHLPWC
jgi:hypothetical protein